MKEKKSSTLNKGAKIQRLDLIGSYYKVVAIQSKAFFLFFFLGKLYGLVEAVNSKSS